MMPSDAQVRVRALDPTTSFICEAPAGSGKTELLTQRVLTLLARVQVPEAVLAITFTRKAAAEMQERVLHALALARAPEPEDAHRQTTWRLARQVLAHDASLGWHLQQNPNRLQIKTFDGLARQLMQSLPLHAGLDASWLPANDPEPLYQEAVRDLLNSLEQAVPWADALQCLFKHLDNRYPDLENLLVAMLRTRDNWMAVLSSQPNADMRSVLEYFLEVCLQDHVQTLHQLIAPQQARLLLQLAQFAGMELKSQLSDSPIVALAEIDPESLPGADNAGRVQWLALTELLLTQKQEWRKSVNKNQGFGTGEKGIPKDEKQALAARKQQMQELLTGFTERSDLLTALQDVRNWPTPNFSDEQWPVLQALTQILPIAVVHLHWVFQKHQVLDFTEISQRARLALGDEDAPTDLMQRLDYRIQHILVDEFQDTSFTQVDLLKKLTYGWEPGDGRTLFCVGDAMQSIYSFRGANVGLFLFVKQAGLGPLALEPLQLTANFRSQAGIVQWVNKTFTRAFPQRVEISSGAVPYSQAEAIRAAANKSASVHVFDPEQSDSSAQWLVDEVTALWREQPEYRVGILVKSRSHAGPIVAALAGAGIRYRALDMVPLVAREVIQDALALTLALLDPGDRIAWLALLRAPWCGLLLKDLTLVANCSAPSTPVLAQMQQALKQYRDAPTQSALAFEEVSSLSDDGAKRLARVYQTLASAIETRARKPLAIWVEGVWRALGGQSLVVDAADFDNLERYWQMLEALQAEGELPTVTQLQRAVAALYAAPDPLADERVQIMTIHKSKGLEFDVVFLPDLQRGSVAVDKELLLWQERLSHSGEDTLLMAAIGAKGQDQDPIYQHLLHEKKKRLKLEECRLLYVACTRARERLYLMANLKRADKGETLWQSPRADSLLAAIWSEVNLLASSHHPEVSAPEAQVEQALGEPVEQVTLLKRLPSHWQAPPKPELEPLAAFVIRQGFNNDALPELPSSLVDCTPRWLGTVVHETLYALASSGRAQLQLASQANVWATRLQQLGMPVQELDTAVKIVTDSVQRTIAHARWQWLLTQPERYFEWPLRTWGNGEGQTVVLDAMVVDEAGTAWIVDYKTATPAQDEPPSVFLKQQQQTYAPTLARYAKAVSALGYPKVKCVLWFINTGDWLEVC